MSDPFKDRLKRLHGARRRANERAENQESRGTFHARDTREFEDADDVHRRGDRPATHEAPGPPPSSDSESPSQSEADPQAGPSRPARPSETPEAAWQDVDYDPAHAYGDYRLDQARDRELCALFERFADKTAPKRPEDIAFLDTETTGLSRDDLAFCAGLGFWRDDTFRVRVFHLRADNDEPAFLESLSEHLGDFDGLCTFNGASFDLPLLTRRYERHDLAAPFESLTHFDLLAAAREVFEQLDSHKLSVLEEKCLGAARQDDLPGREAPRRWSRYLETGRMALLEDVFDHNRRDILALVVLLPALAGRSGAAASSTPEPPSFEPNDGSVASRLQRSLKARKRSSQSRSDDGKSSSKGGSDTGDSSRGRSRRSDDSEKTWSLSSSSSQPSPARSSTAEAASTQKNARPVPSDASGVPYDSTARPGERVETVRDRANRIIREDGLRAAAPLLHEIVALSPRHPWALERLARFHRQNGRGRLASHFQARLDDAAPF